MHLFFSMQCRIMFVACFVYLGSTELGDPLGGLVGGAHDELVIDSDLKTVVGSDDLGLEDAGVLGVRVDGLETEKRQRGKRKSRNLGVSRVPILS